MSDLDPRAARALLVADLNRFMVGPIAERERIPERAHDRYHTGYLSPTGSVIPEDEDDQNSIGDDEHADNILVLANQHQQGALGITVQVADGGTSLTLAVSWADYRYAKDQDDLPVWDRAPVSRRYPFVPAECVGNEVLGVFDDIEVRARVRERDGAWSITATVVNRRTDPPRDDEYPIDRRIYQLELSVEASDGSPVFVVRPSDGVVSDDEFWNHELLYGHVRPFAVGHGCSVAWDSSDDGRRATRIYSQWIPTSEVRKASADVLKGDSILDLATLSRFEDRATVCTQLALVPDTYGTWVSGLRTQVDGIVSSFPESRRLEIRRAAEANLAACDDAARRMREGITFLRTDDSAWNSFCLANEAMARSMRQTRDGEPRWRAFQLAFILMTLESTARRDHPDRGVLDLIWFPTGGGKTEAYLGLAAFSMIHRRLTHPDVDPGTSVFTRYTLRLLTIQQFERAARLICACELLRRDGRLPKAAAFTIGLFVGGGATPNTVEEAKQLLRLPDRPESGATTLPLEHCPWCGERIDHHQQMRGKELITRCGDEKCPFRARLPLVVVDEEIYSHPPSMVVATVDKFARMPWEPNIRKLFGIGSESPPPDLIIQDELHLINDALGTMVALYETAIDHLCSVQGSPPKLVGSTATIRRADRQVRGVFNRTVAQFPPSGLSMEDSFFYREDREHPGRLYVGVHAQGRSPKHTLARVLGTLAQSSVQISDPKLRDPYHTIVAYFNSLRELGGALVLAEDDVRRYIDSMPVEPPTRYLRTIEELTSNLPSHRIPELLHKLASPLPGVADHDDLDVETVDLVLSTNMISVGVDVDRLGLMVINGQPKTTSEYIQASSRVGRPTGAAGLVVTIYNWTRPRDRSHYERFVTYHGAFYRHVESTSVTPFSARARNRALHAVLVALARLGDPTFVDNASAASIRNDSAMAVLRQQIEVIVTRALQVDPDEAESTRADLDRILDLWAREAENPNLLFARKGLGPQSNLLRQPDAQLTRGQWPTPQSMRDVDPPSPVTLLKRYEMERRTREAE